MALTISEQKISLWIAGNQNRAAGFENLVMIKPQFPPLTYSSHPGMNAQPYYIVVNIGETYTQYTLVFNHVTSSDGVPNCVLKIAIGIPRNHRIVGGTTTPFDVLGKLRKAMITNYMSPVPGQNGSFIFRQDRPDPSVFAGILDSINLEETNMVHRPMKGTEDVLVILPPDKIKTFLNDVQYQEFTPYKEVVVATYADESAYGPRVIKNLEVPRRPNFKLFVNGKPATWPEGVRDPFTELSTFRSTADDRYYTNRTVSFTINALMSGKNYNGVTIDQVKEEIHVQVSADPKVVTYRVDLEGVEQPQQLMSKMKVTVQGKPVTLINGQFSLRGEENKLINTVRADYAGNDYKVDGQKWIGTNLRVHMKAAGKPGVNPNRPTTGTLGLNTGGGMSTGGGGVVIRAIGDVEMAQGQWDLIVEMGNGDKVDKKFNETVKFSRDAAAHGKNSVLISTPVQLPDNWAGTMVNIYLQNDKYVTDSVTKTLQRGENKVQFSELKNRISWQKFIVPAAAALIAAVVIVGVIFGIKSCSGESTPIDTDTLEIGETENTNPFDTLKKTAGETPVVPAGDSFAAIKANDASGMGAYDAARQKVLVKLIDAIEAKKADEVKKIAEDKKGYLTEDEYWAIQEIYYGWKDASGYHEYNSDGIKGAQAKFKNGSFSSFNDLKSLHQGQGEYGKGAEKAKDKADKQRKAIDKAKDDASKPAETTKSEGEKPAKKEAPKKEVTQKEAPKKEVTQKEQPKKEQPKKEEVKKEEPKKEEPKEDR